MNKIISGDLNLFLRPSQEFFRQTEQFLPRVARRSERRAGGDAGAAATADAGVEGNAGIGVQNFYLNLIRLAGQFLSRYLSKRRIGAGSLFEQSCVNHNRTIRVERNFK